MRKYIFMIATLMMLSACGGKKSQMESTVVATADSTVAETKAETDSETSASQNFNLMGTIGEEKGSMTLEKNGNDVTGTVTRCDYCEPIDVKGTWLGDNIQIEGVSLAGSHITYELTVSDNTAKGSEILAAEGEVEKQDITMNITASN